jgi:prepilin-type processing-associated H-X9-DG protein
LAKQDPIWSTLTEQRDNAVTIKMNRKLALATGTNPSNSLTSSAIIKLAAVAEPGRTVLLFDARATDVWSGDTTTQNRFDGWETLAALRHKNRANVLFVDGHVELRSAKPRVDGKHGWENNQSGLVWYGK